MPAEPSPRDPPDAPGRGPVGPRRGDARQPRRATGTDRRRSPLRAYALSVALVALASAIGVPVHLVISPTNLVMFYLAAVVIAALYLGRGPAMLAAVLGILALDLFFVPPRLTLTVADTEYLLTFAGLFVVGLIVSSLTAQLRDQAGATREREAEARALYAFSRDLARAGGLEEILDTIAERVRNAFGREVVVLLPRDGALTAHLATSRAPSGDDDRGAADWSFQQGQPSGRGTDTLPGAVARYLPLKTARGTVGVLAVRPGEPGTNLMPEQRRLLEAFASLAALAVERAQLAEAARQTQLAQATEKLQSALLDSISHDLRTPLVTITGALTALEDETRAAGPAVHRLDDDARRGLLTNARQEAQRLNRLVGNLLDLARLQAGAMRVTADPVYVEALIGSALERLGDRLADHPVKVTASPRPTIVPLDAALMVQVLVNLLDNAAKHGQAGGPIEVRVDSSDGGLSLSVADDGPGVPAAELDHIFDKFHRVQRNGAPGGTGLGLAVCKGIVEAHGGRIAARNRTPRGLAVEVFLPGAEAGRDGKPVGLEPSPTSAAPDLPSRSAGDHAVPAPGAASNDVAARIGP